MNHPIRRLAFSARVSLLVPFLLLAAGCGRVAAQSLPTAERTVGLNLFAAGTRLSTDYGADNYGFTAGADLTRYFRRFAPSLEARYTYSIADAVAEDSTMGGVKVETAYRRFHPYGDVLVGYGTLRFVHPSDPNYTHDNSVVYGAGAGLEYVLSPRIELKADGQYEHWHLGQAAGSLTPHIFSLGITYRFPPKKLMARMQKGRY